MKEKIYNIAVVLIMLLAIIIRIIHWPNGFGDINCDEAMLAINARSISENGTDIYGTSFPIYFETWLISGQSSLSTYITALSILIFGFNLFAIRLPILLISIISIFIVFLLTKKIFNKEIGIVTLFLVTINPWHIMQSQWNLDCNLFPHLILIGIYLLYIGIENKKNIFVYLSMIFFGFSMYSYGISIYFVPLFLLTTGIYLLKTRKVKISQFIICFIIYLLIFLPLLLMYIINYFEIETVNLGVFTIQRFIYQVRTNDMLIFSENILTML